MFVNNLVVVYFLVWILSILAIKHIAYILIYGSIFEPTREELKRRAKTGGAQGWVFKKLSGMFSCNLCMITQLTFWLFITPLYFFTSNIGGTNVALTIVSAFLLWMATASLSMLYWNFSEFRLERFVRQRDYYEELLSKVVSTGKRQMTFNMESTEELLGFIDDECSHIDCPFRREDCVYDAIRTWVKNKEGHEWIIIGDIPVPIKKVIKEAYFSRRLNKENADAIFVQITEET